MFFSHVASPFGEVENVEVWKRKYENESAERKYGSEKVGSHSDSSCVGGAPRPYRKGLGRLSVSSSFLVYAYSEQADRLPAKYGSEKKRVGAASY